MTGKFVQIFTTNYYDDLLQYERVRDAAWASDWVGMPISYQRCILFIISKSNQEFNFTAGKFVAVSHSTLMNVRLISVLIIKLIFLHVHIEFINLFFISYGGSSEN